MSKPIGEKLILEFLGELNSPMPAPGGGAVAGLCGAMAAGLSGMVAHLTVGRVKFAAVEPKMQEALERAKAYQEEMVELARQDEEAFNTLMAAYGLPKDTEAAAAEREAAVQAATKEAAKVPLQVAKVCEDIIRLAQDMVKSGNPMLVTDGAASGLLARAAVRISSYNVRVNMNSIKDRSFNTEIGALLNRYEHNCAILENAIVREADRILLKN